MGVTLFVSCVSAEFGRYRDALLRALDQFDVSVKIQENFKHRGDDTLAMLEDYIAACEGVVHFIGATTGSAPPPISVERLLERNPGLEAKLARLGLSRADLSGLSYTQWEAWLAASSDCDLVIATPAACAAMDLGQAEHLKRLKAIARWPAEPFADVHHLVAQVMTSAIKNILAKAGRKTTPRQPANLPYPSLGRLFKGRDAFLDKLRVALCEHGRGAVAGKAVHGLGGVGKTRAAVEYAHRFGANYSALLFVGAETPERLESNLAALAGAAVLDLPEQDAREDSRKIAAVLGWLSQHPTWLVIFDNVDDETACTAAAQYLAQMKGGHVLVTGRLADYPPEFAALDLGVLDRAASQAFLIERTGDRRAKANDDAAQAAALAEALGDLALGLEQASAYIRQQRIGFARYLALWREKRETVLNWFDKRLTSYNHDAGLATTWAASVDKLSPEGRRLLDRLAFLAPEPIPDFLVDVKAEGDDLDARAALPGLYAYSLIAPAIYEAGKIRHDGFAVHRLLQDYARRAMDEARRGEALQEALAWLNAGFSGQPDDVRTWPRLDPLAPHALAVAEAGDEAATPELTGVLFSKLGVLYSGKARYREEEIVLRRTLAIGEAHLPGDSPVLAIRLNNLAFLLDQTNRAAEAEPLFRRALAIGEASLGPDHPSVAIRLSNLASLLLKQTNRSSEAEPLIRRALEIDEASLGPDHPNVAIRLNNLASLLQDTNRAAEAEPLYRRALAIDEASYGPDHPNVAIRLNNLAVLLRATNRAAEAEPLYRRALEIDQASYGPDHPNVATDLNNLAMLLQATDRAAEAEPLYRRALAIDEASLGPDHPNVAIRLNNLALLLGTTNRAAQAEPLIRRALTIFEASYGSDHPRTRLVRENLRWLTGEAG